MKKQFDLLETLYMANIILGAINAAIQNNAIIKSIWIVTVMLWIIILTLHERSKDDKY